MSPDNELNINRKKNRRAGRLTGVGLGISLAMSGCASPAPTPVETSIFSAVETSSPTQTATTQIEHLQISYPARPASISAISCDYPLAPNAQVPEKPSKEPPANFTLKVPILMYHLVTENPGNALPGLVVSPATFKAQMEKLHKNGWKTITAAALAKDLGNMITPPKKTFVITFDDGHVDGYTKAWPILKKLGYNATFYMITGRTDRSGYLSSEQLKELTDQGNDIGDHTVGHLDLRYGNLDYQIDKAAVAIARITGKWPTTLAYPAGEYNMSSERAVERCEPLTMAVTTNPGARETWGGRYAVPRVRVTPDTSPTALLNQLNNYIK